RHRGGEVGDGGVTAGADAVGAAPVPGGGGVGVVGRDGGVAALAAAEHLHAACEEVLGGVEVFVADDGFDVIQDGDGHDDGSFCDWRLSVRSRCRGGGLVAGGGRAGGGGRVGDGDDFVSDGAELADSPVVAAASGLVVDAGVQESG